MTRIKTPEIGYGDIGIGTHPDSPIEVGEWMRQITNAVNGISQQLGYKINIRLKPKQPLTDKQYEVYEFIKSYALTHTGMKPRLEDIRQHFGYKGISSAQRHVEALILKGVLARGGHSLYIVEYGEVPNAPN